MTETSIRIFILTCASFSEQCTTTKVKIKTISTINRFANLAPISSFVNLPNVNNTMIFAIMVDKAEATVFTKIWKVSGTDFLNMMGGGLGLCLGFSLISSLFYMFDTSSPYIEKALKILSAN